MKRKQSTGIVSYYVRRTATNFTTHETSITHFGPFISLKEAESKKREDDEAVAQPGYEYDYEIQCVPFGFPPK